MKHTEEKHRRAILTGMVLSIVMWVIALILLTLALSSCATSSKKLTLEDAIVIGHHWKPIDNKGTTVLTIAVKTIKTDKILLKYCSSCEHLQKGDTVKVAHYK